MTEREGQIVSLNQAVTDRDGQLAKLNQAMTEREGQIDYLKQKISKLDERCDALERIVESAKQWQNRPWAARVFHRWREPDDYQKKLF
jgi:chromosome segregation ATPase